MRWATGPDSCALVERAGISAVATGMTQGDRVAEFWRRYPETRDLPPQRWPDVMFPKVFGEINAPAALTGLLPLVSEWRPELVVHDAAELAAPIAAAAVGVPNVTHAFGALLPEAECGRRQRSWSPCGGRRVWTPAPTEAPTTTSTSTSTRPAFSLREAST